MNALLRTLSGFRRRMSSSTRPDAAAFDRIVLSRSSAKEFDASRPVPDDLRNHLLRLAQQSPSGFNAQPWIMIAVQSEDARRALATAMVGGANSWRVSTAPLSVVFAADLQAALSVNNLQVLERRAGKGVRYLRSLETDLAAFSSVTGSPVEHAAKTAILRAGNALGGQLPTVNSPEAWAFKNTAFAAQTLMLAATAHGLASCAMEGFNGHAVRKVCAIPERYGVPLIVALGYAVPQAAQQQPKSLRYSLDAAARKDTFDVPLTEFDGTSESN